MATLIAVVVIFGIIVFGDHVRYWRKLDEFDLKANEFVAMYKTIMPLVLHGEPNKPDVDYFYFYGEFFYVLVQKNDLKSFYNQMELAICEVLDAYDRIGDRYLSMMDDETEYYIGELYKKVQDINCIIRYESWLNGYNKR